MGCRASRFTSFNLFPGLQREGDQREMVWIQQRKALPTRNWPGVSAPFSKCGPGPFGQGWSAYDDRSEESHLWRRRVEGICTYW